MANRSYSIAKLKAGLSSALADVARGGEIVITDHNRPVARIVPVSRVPPLPDCDPKTLLRSPPLPLRRGAKSSAALVRRMRDEE